MLRETTFEELPALAHFLWGHNLAPCVDTRFNIKTGTDSFYRPAASGNAASAASVTWMDAPEPEPMPDPEPEPESPEAMVARISDNLSVSPDTVRAVLTEAGVLDDAPATVTRCSLAMGSAEICAPFDPECPGAIKVEQDIVNMDADPMTSAMGAPVGEIAEAWKLRHWNECERCQEYGMAHVC